VPLTNALVKVSVVWNKPTGKFDIRLLTDFAALSIALADVTAAVQIFGPAGLIYTNPFYLDPSAGPDIDADVSLTNSLIDFPIDIEGDILEGDYTFDVAVEVAGVAIYSQQSRFTYAFEIPSLSVSMVAQCESSRITVTVDPSAPAGTTTQELLTTTVNYPPAAGDEDPLGTSLPITFTTLTRILTPVAVGAYSAASSSRYLHRLGLDTGTLSEFFIRYTQAATTTFDLDCKGLCAFYCQLKSLHDQYYDACRSRKSSEASRLSRIILEAMLPYVMLRESVNCGKTTDRTIWERRLTEILGECDCECEESDSIWIEDIYTSIGIGAGTSYSFFAGSGLAVSVSGTSVTYSLSADFLASLTALFSSVTGLPLTGLLECNGTTPITGSLGELLQRLLNTLIPSTGTTCPVTGVIEMSNGSGFRLKSGISNVVDVAFSTTTKKLQISLDPAYVFQIIGTTQLTGDLLVIDVAKTNNFTIGSEKVLGYLINAQSNDVEATIFDTAGGFPPTQNLFFIKRTDTSAFVVTLTPDATYTIDGAANYLLASRESLWLKYRNGTEDIAIVASHLPKATVLADPVPGTWSVIGTPGQPAFFGAAVNASPTLGRPTTAYRKFLTKLELRGVVDSNGSIATDGGNLALFTLPAGFLPTEIYEYPSGINLDVAARTLKIVVNTSGVVFVEASGGTYPYVVPHIFLNGITVPLS